MGQTTLNSHPSAGQGGPTPPPQDLYAKRQQIYPKLAHGKFRTVKWAVMAITLGIYYLLPWLRWDRGEGIPNQAVLADFESEKFYFFFIEIWPQDIHFLAGLLILASLGLFPPPPGSFQDISNSYSKQKNSLTNFSGMTRNRAPGQYRQYKGSGPFFINRFQSARGNRTFR